MRSRNEDSATNKVTIVNVGRGNGALALSCQPSRQRSAATVVTYGKRVTGFTGYDVMKAIDTITVVEGYEAMRIFLETVRRRHGDPGGQIELIIGGLKWADGTPVDPTMWEDWLAAGQAACNCRTP
jgi:hypothetical protein